MSLSNLRGRPSVLLGPSSVPVERGCSSGSGAGSRIHPKNGHCSSVCFVSGVLWFVVLRFLVGLLLFRFVSVC